MAAAADDDLSDEIVVSDDEEGMDGIADEIVPVEPLQGALSKWTNYIHGWQRRYISLHDGNIVYYKSANDTENGCRGALSIAKAEVILHDQDELRFDVSVLDSVWYLRAENVEDRHKWTDGIETYRMALKQQRLKPRNLTRQGSIKSIGSVGSYQRKNGRVHKLEEKLEEIEMYRESLSRQIKNLRTCLDDGSSTTFTEEAVTFMATTAGISTTLAHCIELMNKKEECWNRKLDKEQQARIMAEARCRNAVSRKLESSFSESVRDYRNKINYSKYTQ
jgi:collagen type IV alpha-3-binding protein